MLVYMKICPNPFSSPRQFSNKYYKHREKGVYTCVVCSIQHFSSASKYDSGSGWPSFFDIIDKKKIRLRKDASGGLDSKQIVVIL